MKDIFLINVLDLLGRRTIISPMNSKVVKRMEEFEGQKRALEAKVKSLQETIAGAEEKAVRLEQERNLLRHEFNRSNF